MDAFPCAFLYLYSHAFLSSSILKGQMRNRHASYLASYTYCPFPGTHRRPVPLEHCVYYGNEIYPVMRGDVYLADGMQKVVAAHKARTAPPPSAAGGAAARPTGRGEAQGPNRGGRGGGGGGGRGGGGGGGYGQRGGSADNARRQVQGERVEYAMVFWVRSGWGLGSGWRTHCSMYSKGWQGQGSVACG